MSPALAQAEDLARRLGTAAAQTRAFCSSADFRGDRSACSNGADMADQFVRNSGAPGGRLALARAGDDAAAGKFSEGAARILLAVTGIPVAMRDNTASDLLGRIQDDLEDVAKPAAFGIGAVAAAVVSVIVADKLGFFRR